MLAAVFPAEATDCDCDYYPGGCIISEAPPSGFKCRCLYMGFWTCTGQAIGCDAQEKNDGYCPGDCYSIDCCNYGGGDCGGYFKSMKYLKNVV